MTTSRPWIAWLLAVLLAAASVPAAPLSRAAAETCYDEIDDRTYSDCPPPEMLDGKTRRERSELLKQWQPLSADVKNTYRTYIQCKKILLDLGPRLHRAQLEHGVREGEYRAQYEVLVKSLIQAFIRLGLQTTTILVDAKADLDLALRQLKSSVTSEVDRAKKQAEMLVEFERQSRKASAARELYQALANEKLAKATDDLAKAQEEEARRRAGASPSSALGKPLDPSKVADDDLLYGLYTDPKLAGRASVFQLRDDLGKGKLLIETTAGGQTPPPFNRLPYPGNIIEWSKSTLSRQAAAGKKIIFDVTGMQPVKGVLDGSHFPGAITSEELRHIRSNWADNGGVFNSTNVTFVERAPSGHVIVVQPW